MEIFQKLWVVLITQNKVLINIISIPMLAIEVFITMLIFIQLLNINANKKQKTLYVTLVLIFASFSQFLIPSPYNTLLNTIFCPILAFIIFKTSILKAILSAFLPMFIFGFIGLFLIEGYSFLFNISTSTINIIPIHKLVSSLILYLCIFCIYLVFVRFNININLLDKMKQRNNTILILNFITGSIGLIAQTYIIYFYLGRNPSFFNILITLMSFTYFSISIYSLFRTNKLEITSQHLEEEKLYNKTLTILYDNIRGFKHDFNNIVQAIGGYISTKNLKGLNEYYSQLLDDCQKVNNLTILSPEIINNPAIYSLLTSKYHMADEIGVHISLEVFLDLNTINMKIYELTRILGILIDNGIEAASKCEEKVVTIIVRKDPKLNRQLFIIENTYLDKSVNIDKIFEKGYTSKEMENKGHGLGLWEVRKVLKKNNNLNIHTTKDNKYFKQQLEIYY